MALIEGCKHRLEITIPAQEAEQETNRAVEHIKEKVRIPGFRPGKVPASMIRTRFAQEIRQEVLEALIPRHLRETLDRENLSLIGSPEISEVKWEKDEPLRFTAEFEVAPEIELEEYLGVSVEYEDPVITDEDVDKRLEQIREQKAEYVNIDPRPAESGDYAVVSLRSVAGLEGEPIEHDEITLHLGDEDTLEDFSKNLAGMEPGQESEFDVTYPEEYGEPRLAGKTIRFQATLKTIRKKELPELNDDFAEDLGDYKGMEELRDAVRTALATERELIAQQQAKNALVEKLVDLHNFPVPETYIERQIEMNVERRMRELVAQGVDPRGIKLDWQKVKESQREPATRDVKASLILERIAERESIEVTRDEVDRQVERIARERREPVIAVRQELEESGDLRRIASRIRTEKTLSFLFEKARKTAPAS